MALTQMQIAAYRRDGFIRIDDALDAGWLARLRSAIDELRDRARDLEASTREFDVAPGHSRGTPRLRRIKDPVDRHPVFDELMRSPCLVDRVAPLLGGTVRFDHSKLNFKPPGGSAGIAWHQDWAFYPHTNDDLLAVGVMVEDCTEDNGPLRVIPGSHRGPVHDHHQDGQFVGGVPRERLGDEVDRAVALTGHAGAITIHHVRTLHASSENRTTAERPLLLYSYAAVDAFPVFAAPDLAQFDARILRGEPTLQARTVVAPVRLPLPRPESADSIFDNQAAMRET